MEEKKLIKKLLFSFLPIPEELMKSKALSFGAKFLFGIIAKTNLEKVRFSVDYLSKRMGCSMSETKSRIKELKENNLIRVKRTGRSNIYEVNFELVQLIQEPMSTNEDIRSSGSVDIRGSDSVAIHNKEHFLKKIIKEDNDIKNLKKLNELKTLLLKKLEMNNPLQRTQAQEEAAGLIRPSGVYFKNDRRNY